MQALKEEKFMRMAIASARKGVSEGQAPFGACIVKGNKAVCCAHNTVWADCDITSHAEVHAIRLACRKLGSISLAGCDIYSTTEPCPMCFSAIHWSGIRRIVYGSSIADAKRLGFNELVISDAQMKRTGKSKILLKKGVLARECIALFALFRGKTRQKRLY